MEETFLRISNGRIVAVEWTANYSYSEQSYERWKLVRLSDTQEGESETRDLESVNCLNIYSPARISITETQSADTRKAINTTRISIGDFDAITKHIEANRKEIDVPAKQVYTWLYEQDAPF